MIDNLCNFIQMNNKYTKMRENIIITFNCVFMENKGKDMT